MHSIATRISAGFFGLSFLILVLSAVTFSDLHYLERQFRQGSVVSGLVERVMEMRRQEKNFLLYAQGDDLAAALQQAQTAKALFDGNRALFDSLCLPADPGDRDCSTLGEDLQDYAARIAALISGTAKGGSGLAEGVRISGHRIAEQVRGLGNRERNVLAQAVGQSRNWLLETVAVVGVLGGLLGAVIARSVVRPLRQLEEELATIAAGRFHDLPAPSRDRELISFTAAFNRMLAELEVRRRQLLHSEKLASLGVLVSGVAHELNNPLSNISTSCQLALEEADYSSPEEMREWLRQIDEQTDRARHIVLALTDYAGGRPLTLEPVPVQEMVDRTLLLARQELGRQVTLEQEIPADLTVLADRQRLQQIFINLLKNAVDAGGAEVAITIRGRLLDDDAPALPTGRYRLGELPPSRDAAHPERPRYALLTVADDGPGIAPEALEQIFDPFFTTRDVGHGMGLGLYIVQEIVQELDGCIAVDSEPGRGTRFEIALPCA